MSRTASPPSEPVIYSGIQSMRGVAAILVLAMHLIQTLDVFYRDNGSNAGIMTLLAPYARPLGLVGVDLFFVISGFVLYLTARRTAAERDRKSALRFIVKRALRVYPLYWVVFFFVAATSAIPIEGFLVTALSDWREILLVDTSNRYSVVGPAWTLMYELYFYVSLGVILALTPRRLDVCLLAWVGIHLILALLARFGWITNVNPITDAILLDFAAGMLIARLSLRGRLPAVPLVLATAPVFLVAGFAFLAIQTEIGQVDRFWRFATFGLFSVALIYVVVDRDSAGRQTFPSLRPLGNASYSLYLWHVPIFWTFNWIGVRYGWYDFQSPYLAAFVWTTASIAVAILSYRWIERPAMRLASRLTGSGKGRGVVALRASP